MRQIVIIVPPARALEYVNVRNAHTLSMPTFLYHVRLSLSPLFRIIGIFIQLDCKCNYWYVESIILVGSSVIL